MPGIIFLILVNILLAILVLFCLGASPNPRPNTSRPRTPFGGNRCSECQLCFLKVDTPEPFYFKSHVEKVDKVDRLHSKRREGEERGEGLSMVEWWASLTGGRRRCSRKGGCNEQERSTGHLAPAGSSKGDTAAESQQAGLEPTTLHGGGTDTGRMGREGRYGRHQSKCGGEGDVARRSRSQVSERGRPGTRTPGEEFEEGRPRSGPCCSVTAGEASRDSGEGGREEEHAHAPCLDDPHPGKSPQARSRGGRTGAAERPRGLCGSVCGRVGSQGTGQLLRLTLMLVLGTQLAHSQSDTLFRPVFRFSEQVLWECLEYEPLQVLALSQSILSHIFDGTCPIFASKLTDLHRGPIMATLRTVRQP